MKTSYIIAGVVLGCALLFVSILGLWTIGTYNTAKTLKNQYDAKLKANEAIFDNMWKKITQSHQVTGEQKEALKSIFVDYAKARTSPNAGAVMNWVKEAIPNPDLSLYKTLLNVITGSRDEWTANQVALVDIAREYNLMLEKFPSNVLLGAFGFQKIDAKIISSTRTDAAFKSGKDDDVKLD